MEMFPRGKLPHSGAPSQSAEPKSGGAAKDLFPDLPTSKSRARAASSGPDGKKKRPSTSGSDKGAKRSSSTAPRGDGSQTSKRAAELSAKVSCSVALQLVPLDYPLLCMC